MLGSSSAAVLRGLAWLPTLFGIALLVLLIHHPPTESSFYPKCMFHAATGGWCPGCGGTRALYHLARGELAEAVGQNALVVLVAVPFVVCILGKQLRFALTGIWKPLKQSPERTVLIVGIIVVTFWILRNVPIYPFSWMAPTEIG